METAVVITIITVAAAVLEIILFFKVWGMTNDVDKLMKHFTSSDNDQYLMYLRHYTNDYKFLIEVFELKTDISFHYGLDHGISQTWVEDYLFNVKGGISVIGNDGYPVRLQFNIDAICNGDPRLKGSWSFVQKDEGNEIPSNLKR